jgi:hypothetical protein
MYGMGLQGTFAILVIVVALQALALNARKDRELFVSYL